MAIFRKKLIFGPSRTHINLHKSEKNIKELEKNLFPY